MIIYITKGFHTNGVHSKVPGFHINGVHSKVPGFHMNGVHSKVPGSHKIVIMILKLYFI